MSTGRITGRRTWPQRRVYFWWRDSGRFVSWLMALNTLFITVLSLREWLLNDFLFWCLSIFLCFVANETFYVVSSFYCSFFYCIYGSTCLESICLFIAQFFLADMAIFVPWYSVTAWDWSSSWFLLYMFTLHPLRVLIWIHSDVYLKNVILLLKRWNKIMLFFPRKKK